ncbi:hypothetical protein E2C01_025247 [Portunus trituberculatus]|uniref:Uncharacterized protein n=1 Tax=Portunus trituberculatus TaxID=210409 RepID=A0A5B7EF31_PORTR|nr:hypothetical protein [Portunus trituberculatus]
MCFLTRLQMTKSTSFLFCVHANFNVVTKDEPSSEGVKVCVVRLSSALAVYKLLPDHHNSTSANPALIMLWLWLEPSQHRGNKMLQCWCHSAHFFDTVSLPVTEYIEDENMYMNSVCLNSGEMQAGGKVGSSGSGSVIDPYHHSQGSQARLPGEVAGEQQRRRLAGVPQHSEKSSSTIGSGRGLAGLLRGGGGKPLPLEPEEVEGRERRSNPSSEDVPPAAEVEGVREVTELRPKKERAGGGEEMDIPESGELLEEEEEEDAEEEDVHVVVEDKDEDEEGMEGEVDVVALEEGVEVAGDGSAFSAAFSDALIFASMFGVMMVPRMEGGGCHNTTSMLGFVL